MKGLLVERYGDPGVLGLADLSDPLPGVDEVAIDVAFAGVNYADIMARRGEHPAFVPPFVPGLEVSGHVHAVGERVDGLTVGQPVSALTLRGGYASVAIALAALTYPLAEVTPEALRAGAAFPTIVPTAWALVHDVARLSPGEDILVQAAAGGVGTVLAQVARCAGARSILGVVSNAEKASYATQFGFDDIFVGPDWPQHVREVTSGRGVDVVFDSIGGSVRQSGFDVLAPLGRLVCFGNACAEPEVGFSGDLLRGQVKSTMGWSISGLAGKDPARVRAIALRALSSFASGELTVDITEVVPLQEAGRAHGLIESRASMGKLVLDLSSAE